MALILLLDVELDIVGLFRIGSRTDKDEFGALHIKQLDVLASEPAAAEFPLKPVWIVRLLGLSQSKTGRAGLFGILHRKREACLRCDVEGALPLRRPLWKLECVA